MSDLQVYLTLGMLMGRLELVEEELGFEPVKPLPVGSAAGLYMEDALGRLRRAENHIWPKAEGSDDPPALEPVASDLKRTGNVVCLPGVMLSVKRRKRSRKVRL